MMVRSCRDTSSLFSNASSSNRWRHEDAEALMEGERDEKSALLTCVYFAETPQRSSKHLNPNLMNAAHMYSKCVSACLCVFLWAGLLLWECLPACVCVCVCARLDGEMERAREREERKEGWRWSRWTRGDQQKRITARQTIITLIKISPPTLLQRLRSRCRAGII